MGAVGHGPGEIWVEGPAGAARSGVGAAPEGDGSTCSTMKSSTLSRGSRAKLVGGLGVGGCSLKMSAASESTWRAASPNGTPPRLVPVDPGSRGTAGGMTSGATAGSVRDLFFRIRGSSGIFEASSSSSASPDGGRHGAAAVLGAAGFFEEVAVLFLVDGESGRQQQGIDYNEVFAPVARHDTIKFLLALAAQYRWKVYHLDVKSAFLNGKLKEEIFVEQPQGYEVSNGDDMVYKLNKALYGLKQAPRAWYHELHTFLIHFGFKNSLADTSLFVYHDGSHIMYLIVYVDDLILTGDQPKMLNDFVTILAKKFSLKDLGSLSYFLGIKVVPN